MPSPGSTVPDAGHISNEDDAEAFDCEIDRYLEENPVRWRQTVIRT